MNKYYHYFIVSILVLLVACNKESDPSPKSKVSDIKIQILSGSDQWDTIGHKLPKKLVIEISRANVLLKDYEVKIQEMKCAAPVITSLKTNELGVVEFSWQLSTTIGPQEIQISVVDPQLKTTSTAKFSAEAKAPAGAWLPVGCLPLPIDGGTVIKTMAQQNSGRLLIGLNTFSAPYFSDNNGQSWQKLTSFPENADVEKILVGSDQEIYLATRNNGIYYSNNNGQTWQSRSTGISDVRDITDFRILRSGKILVGTYFGGLFLSENKGLTWTKVSGKMDFNDRFYDFSESTSGDFYVVSDDSELYKSTDNGLTWNKVTSSSFYNVQTVFTDDNGDIYISTNHFEGDLYRSTDNGITWKLLYTTPDLPGVYDRIKRISKKDGTFYFTVDGYGLIKTTNFTSFEKVSSFRGDYLVYSSGNIILENGYYRLKP